jgi:hypothetical protein
MIPLGTASTNVPAYIEIPTLKTDSGTHRSVKVREEWWRHIQNWKRVSRRLSESYSSRDDVVGVTRSRSDTTIGGMKTKRINIEIDTTNSTETSVGPNTSNGNFPETVDGVRVETVEDSERIASACKNVGTWDDIPGGTAFFNSADQKGTLTPVKEDGEVKSSTVAHTYPSCQRREIYQQNGQQLELGTTDTLSSQYDWQTVPITRGGKSMDSQIRFPDGSRCPVTGWVSKDGAETYESSNKKFYKSEQRKASQKQYKNFDIYRSDECTDYNNKAIDMKSNDAAGDSGGPIFLLTEMIQLLC